MPNIDSPILDAARRQPLPPMPDTQCKKFEAAKDTAFRDDLVTNNGGPQYRGGPIQGGPEPSGKGGSPFNGVDSAGVSFKFKWDIGGNGRPYATDPEVGATVHTKAGEPGKGVGPGMKNGQPPAQPQREPCTGDPPAQPQSGVKPGVAYGNTKDGSSVYTLDDVKKAAGDASAPSDRPKGLNWGDKNQDLKRAIPPPAAPQINDLGPSTNEPEQKAEDAAVARNDDARLGDDIAQRI